MYKKYRQFNSIAILMLVMISISFVSCSKDDDNNKGDTSTAITGNDPEGTVVVNLSNDNKTVYIPETPLRMTPANNIKLMEGYGIKCIGKVNGLAEVKEEPVDRKSLSGHEVAATPGYGYVAMGFYGYTRFYVVNYIESTTGGIIGCTIKYKGYK